MCEYFSYLETCDILNVNKANKRTDFCSFVPSLCVISLYSLPMLSGVTVSNRNGNKIRIETGIVYLRIVLKHTQNVELIQ